MNNKITGIQPIVADGGYTTGYISRVKRNNREYSKSFARKPGYNVSVCLKDAIAWRKEKIKWVERAHGKYVPHRRLRKHCTKNTCGTVGIHMVDTVNRNRPTDTRYYGISMVIGGRRKTIQLYCGSVDKSTGEPITTTPDIEFRALRLSILIRNMYNLYIDNGKTFPYKDLVLTRWRTSTFDEAKSRLFSKLKIG